MQADEFNAAVASVDVLDLCGRLIARPDRTMVSQAAKVALAHSVERLWEVCLEAELLVNALATPTEHYTSEEQFAVRDHAIQTQADIVAGMMTALRGDNPENSKEISDGSSHS